MIFNSHKPKISLIIPIYKCEPFLAKCLDSVLEQTFWDFEIICVDDCTPDNSVAIIERYQKRDPRIRLIRHERNLGLGGTRNTGMKAAAADFIASVDSDDTMKPHMLETLWKASEHGFYDIVNCGFDRVDEEGKILSTQKTADRIITNNGDLDIFNTMNPAYWSKLWRKSLYTENDIWFPNHLYYQDSATTPRILAKAQRIRLIKDSLYNYLVRSGSVSTTASPKHLTDYFKVYDVVLSFLEKEGLEDRYFEELFSYIDRGISHHANLGAQSGLSEAEQTQYLRHLLLFKTGFVEHRKLVAKKNKAELLALLGKAHTKADLLPPDSRPILSVSVIVKTFLRPKMLERFLISVGRYEEQRGVRFAEVLVGDDSPEVDVGANVRAIQKARDLFPHMNVHHYVYEENIGLSDGRNRLVRAAREDHVLVCDDDFIFDEEADILAALRIAQQGDYQLVGGWLKNKYDKKTGSYSYWGAFGQIRETNDELIININEKPIDIDALLPSEYLLNFYIADRASLLANPWDETLKVEEHQEFFYRLKHNGYKAALFGGLFVKHTADRSDNPERYNTYRFSKENWETYLFAAQSQMNKKRRTINRCRDNEFQRWTVDSVKRKSVQNFVPLREPILAQAVPITPVSPRFEQCFGGYYDIRLISSDGRYALCQTVPATDRLPEIGDRADILLIDIKNGNAARKIGSTSAWCHQQGAHAQFMYGEHARVIYNIFDDARGSFAAREIDIESREMRDYSRPVSALSRDGRRAASLNFSRLYDYRPGYGYAHIPDPFAEENAPADDGVWLLDLETGEQTLAISYEAAREFLIREEYEEAAEGKLIFNHVAFNIDGTKLLLLLRVFSKDAPFPTFTLVCNTDGSNLQRAFGFSSHYHWKNADTLVLSGGEGMTRKTAMPIKVFELNTATGDLVPLAPDLLYDDGHCSYSPDRQYLLYDSYSNNSFPYRRLQLYRFSDGKAVELGHFYSPGKWFNNNSDLRCDLHPRWSPDGKTITFDSIHEGYRGVYAIKVEDAIAALDSPLARLTKQDLMQWYKAKYGGPPKSATPAKPVSTPKPLGPVHGGNGANGLAFPSASKDDAIDRFLRKQRKLLRNPKAFFKDSSNLMIRPLHLFWR